MSYPLIVYLRNFVRDKIIVINSIKYQLVYGIKIGNNSIISFGSRLDRSNPKGLYIGDFTYVSRGVTILTHDYVNRIHKKTSIGDNCFLGMNSIILPGVNIGNNVVVAAGSIVTKDVPGFSIVGGNPACIIKSNVEKISKYGQIIK